MTHVSDAMLNAKLNSMAAMVECYVVTDKEGSRDVHATLKGAVNNFVTKFFQGKMPTLKFEDGTECKTKDEIVKKLFNQ